MRDVLGMRERPFLGKTKRYSGKHADLRSKKRNVRTLQNNRIHNNFTKYLDIYIFGISISHTITGRDMACFYGEKRRTGESAVRKICGDKEVV